MAAMDARKRRAVAVVCHNCRYYHVTWDRNAPFGCAAHRFKSALNPARAVFESSGIECQLFFPKERRARKGS
jgi:hypothetical protein